MNAMNCKDAGRHVEKECKDAVLKFISLIESLQDDSKDNLEQQVLMNNVRESKESWLRNEYIGQEQLGVFSRELMEIVEGRLFESVEALKMLAYDLPVCIDKLNRIHAPSNAEAKLDLLICGIVDYACPNIDVCRKFSKSGMEECIACWQEYLDKSIRDPKIRKIYLKQKTAELQ